MISGSRSAYTKKTFEYSSQEENEDRKLNKEEREQRKKSRRKREDNMRTPPRSDVFPDISK